MIKVKDEYLSDYCMESILWCMRHLVGSAINVSSIGGKPIQVNSSQIVARTKDFISESLERDPEFARALGAHPVNDKMLHGLVEGLTEIKAGKLVKSMLDNWEKAEQLGLFGSSQTHTRPKKSGGPYIGPRGGKWADPQHKIPWKESEPARAKEPEEKEEKKKIIVVRRDPKTGKEVRIQPKEKKEKKTKADFDWEKTTTGYKATGALAGKVELLQEGKKWFLVFDDQKHSLPGKTSFDHAEKLIHKLRSGSEKTKEEIAPPKEKEAEKPKIILKPKVEPKPVEPEKEKEKTPLENFQEFHDRIHSELANRKGKSATWMKERSAKILAQLKAGERVDQWTLGGLAGEWRDYKRNQIMAKRSRATLAERKKQAEAEKKEERKGVVAADTGVSELISKEAPPDVKANKDAAAIWEHIKDRRLVESYTIPDYPIGRGYRGQLKVWVEHKPGKGWRTMTQTTNRAGSWNKPKGTTYSYHPTYVIEPKGDERGVLLSVGGWSQGNPKSITVAQVRGQSVMEFKPGDEGAETIKKIVAFAKQRRTEADVKSDSGSELVAKNKERLEQQIEKAKASHIRNKAEMKSRIDQMALVANPDNLKTQARRSHETAQRLVNVELPAKQRQIEAFLKRHGHTLPAEAETEPQKAKVGAERIAELKRQQDVKPMVALSPHQRRMGQFMTPHHEAYRIAGMVDVKGKTVMDPTAGEGRFLKYAKELGASKTMGTEIDHALAKYAEVKHGDFLDVGKGEMKADVLLMNPPFTTGGPNTAAIVDKAINEHWTGKGKAALILPDGPSGEKIIAKHKHLVTHEESLAEAVFKKEGTNVRSKLYILER